MAIAWFLVPYTHVTEPMPYRYCAMDDFTQQIIYTDGGNWSESECLGGHALVKVSAFPATLDTIASTPGFMRVPMIILDNTLAELTQAQRTKIKNKVKALGYTAAEMEDKLGVNLANVTLRRVFKFILTRRLKPRWDADAGEIKVDGEIQMCKSLDVLDGEV